MKPKVLFIDNERRYVAKHIERLEDEYDVTFSMELQLSRNHLQACDKYSCVIVDVMMPAGVDLEAVTNMGLNTGIWLVLKAAPTLLECHIPVILFTNRQHSDVLKGLEKSPFPPGQVLIKAKDETSPKQLLEIVREHINRWIK